MKVYAIQTDPADTTTLDLAKFKSDLQELSARYTRYGIKLLSLGAMTTIDEGGAYIAIWSNEAEPAKN